MDNTLKEYIILKDTLGEVRQNNDVRAERNAQLRERLTNMRADVQGQIGSMLTEMMGLNPADVLSDAEIRKHLTDAFNVSLLLFH